ncbi:hypothetical protein J3R74_000047 [Puniceicoccus vermicola]
MTLVVRSPMVRTETPRAIRRGRLLAFASLKRRDLLACQAVVLSVEPDERFQPASVLRISGVAASLLSLRSSGGIYWLAKP